MITTFDVNKKMFDILNVDEINDIISPGRVYTGKKPTNSEEKDIVIHGNLTFDDDVHSGFLFVNCYCQNHENGLIDEESLEEITDAVLDLLDQFEPSDGTYFYVDVIYQTTIQDNIQTNMSYSSIKLKCYIER